MRSTNAPVPPSPALQDGVKVLTDAPLHVVDGCALDNDGLELSTLLSPGIAKSESRDELTAGSDLGVHRYVAVGVVLSRICRASSPMPSRSRALSCFSSASVLWNSQGDSERRARTYRQSSDAAELADRCSGCDALPQCVARLRCYCECRSETRARYFCAHARATAWARARTARRTLLLRLRKFAFACFFYA